MTTNPRIKVLLVDDVEENLRVLEALLERDDIEALRAAPTKSRRDARRS